MGRGGWLAVLALVLLGAGALRQWSRRTASAEECDPAELRGERTSDGTLVARCGVDGGVPLPAAWNLTLGRKLPLNRASEQELALLPGVGPKLAHALALARGDGGFTSWDEVDAVTGVGPAKLEALRNSSTLEP